MALPPQSPTVADRQRLSLDLSPPVSALLDHVSTVTGVPRSQVALAALLDALPVLVERADQVQARHQAKPGQAVQAGGKGKR